MNGRLSGLKIVLHGVYQMTHKLITRNLPRILMSLTLQGSVNQLILCNLFVKDELLDKTAQSINKSSNQNSEDVLFRFVVGYKKGT